MNLISKLNELNTKRYKLCYDIFMAILAMSIIVSLFYQNRSNLTENELHIINQIDFCVWLVFAIDYFTRLILSNNKYFFFRNNIIDLISILPFNIAFQGFRAARILRIIYMLRVFIYLNRLYKRLNAILTTNDFHHVIWFTFSTIFCGAIAITYIEDMNIGDALWWSFVTTTTVGYGDIAPQSLWGRIVAVFLMIIGIGFLSTLTGTIATFFINDQMRLNYRDEAIQQIISKLKDFQELNIDDINNIHSVLLALKSNQKHRE